MNSVPVNVQCGNNEELEDCEEYALSKEDLISGKMVRCQILKPIGERFFSAPSNTIWIAFEDTDVYGLLNAYCPLNGKVCIRTFQSSSIANKVLQKLRAIRHRNILRYVDFGVLLTLNLAIGLQFCMITEWCSGSSLFNSIHKRRTQFGLFRVLDICQQIVRALIYLHEIGITQCNITSFKIFLCENNTIKIGNFRIMNTENLQWTYWSAPEERYHAPEVHRATHKDQLRNVDTYAFGIIVFELLSQTLPYNCVYNDFYLMHQIEKNRIHPKLSYSRGGSPQTLVKTIAWDQLKECLGFEYQKRPTLRQILIKLNTLKSVTPNYLIKTEELL